MAARQYAGDSKLSCEAGLDRVVDWTLLLDEHLLHDLPEDVSLPVSSSPAGLIPFQYSEGLDRVLLLSRLPNTQNIPSQALSNV